jgi:hypothetical protein
MKLQTDQPIYIWKIFLLFLFVSLFFIINSCSEDDVKPGPEMYTDYVFEVPEITGTTYYIDPVNGSMNGDGSEGNPWRTLQEVVENDLIAFYREGENSQFELVNEHAPVKGGDRLVLLSGYHGYLKRNVFIFEDWLTIEGEQGSTAVLSQFRLEGAFAKIYLNNVTISKESYIGDENYWESDVINRNSDACVYMRADDFWGTAHDIKLNNLTLMTAASTDNWSAGDWVEKAAGGISVRGVPNVEVINCHITNVSMGMAFSDNSNNCRAINNTIRNYSIDGVRLISNDIYFAYNTITDCYKVDDNHDDAIQSYTIGNDGVGTGVIRNVVLRGNLIIGTTNFDNPLAGSPQGIGCFDGFFESWIVENNVVLVDHYHGISFYGMRNGIIAHNTVLGQTPGSDISPWIMIHPHKNEMPSMGCTMINNIVQRSASAGDHNIREANFVLREHDIEDLSELFVNPDEFDFRLKENQNTLTYIIDQGTLIEAIESCSRDKAGNTRDNMPDLGAFEYQH